MFNYKVFLIPLPNASSIYFLTVDVCNMNILCCISFFFCEFLESVYHPLELNNKPTGTFIHFYWRSAHKVCRVNFILVRIFRI
jgi:hypothetical protein